MHLHRAQFTIRSLMIAVVVVAGVLALPGGYGLIVLACCLPCFGVIGAQWLVFRGHRRLAALGFWTLATLTNILYVASCVAPDIYLAAPLFLGWLVIIAPTVAGLGVAWARLATREGPVPAR